MRAVVMLVRSELRRQWRSLAVVVLLVGFAGGGVNESKVSTVALAIVVAVALALANLVAALPARTAARTPAATVLRSE